MNVEKVFEELFKRAKEKHITEQEFSETLSMARSTFWRKKKNCDFNLSEYSRMCHMIGIKPSWLLRCSQGKTRWNRKGEHSKDTSKEVEQ